MSKEVLMVVDAVSNEKGVDKEIIFEALESALASATKKRYSDEVDVRVHIDRHTGAYQAYRRWTIAETVDDPEREIASDHPQVQERGLDVGDSLEIEVEAESFGRIAAQTAKQVIVQKVREAERALIIEAYSSRQGELVSGTVKKAERGNLHLDLTQNAEGLIPREETIPRESFHIGDRVRGYLRKVMPDAKGPQLLISRTAPEFLIELFKLEVPEVGQGVIEIMGAARDPGSRAKIAVRSLDPRLDPVGACVGMRGSRVQSVSNELHGERIDITLWHEDPAQFVINAMAPAEVVSIVLDEETQAMDIAVTEQKLSQAIGRGGQNVRLASQLTGWDLNVMTESEATEKTQAEIQRLVELFTTELEVDETVAGVLVEEGFSSLEEMAYVPTSELMEVEGLDEELITELRNRARDALLTQAIANEEQTDTKEPSAELLAMDGMTDELAQSLAEQGIATVEDLADQAVDDLLGIEGLDHDEASRLIMAARAPWFANEA